MVSTRKARSSSAASSSLMWGLVQPAVLLLLSEQPRHGYALLDELRDRGYLPGEADVGNLYRGLRRLEDDGYVTSEWVQHQGPGPNRRTYRITTKGREFLYEEALSLAQKASAIERLLSEYQRLHPQGPGKASTS